MEDASFCHRCGKATRELLIPEPAEPVEPQITEATPVATPKASAQPVSFSNAAAVRVGFLAASVASMLDALPRVDSLFVLWSALAGYGAVVLYRRRTGQVLSVRSGARMGWITGMLNAVIVIVFFTLSFVASVSEFKATYQQQLSSLKLRDPASYARASGFLESPYALATGVLFLLFAMFFIFTLAGTAGGALGAKTAAKTTTKD